MINSIPAAAIVNVTPSVISTGGTGLDLGGLVLTDGDRVPVGSVMAFTSLAAVNAYFGAVSAEAAIATKYFSGFDGSPIKPAQLLFSQYPRAAVAAYLRGGNISSMTLTQLQALTGTITLSVNGTPVTSGGVNLSGAASFSAAAALIQTALANDAASFTGAIAGNVLTVSAVASGTLAVGQEVVGGTTAPGTVIVSLGTGTGGTGTYNVSGATQTVASGAKTAGRTTVTYDSQSGALVIKSGTPGATSSITAAATGSLATALGLTAATGATVSNGANIATPAGAMSAIAATTQNWASFMTSFKPSIPDMIAFANWTSGQNNRWLYVMWDDDITVTTAGNTASAGYAITLAGYSGVFMIYDPANGDDVAAFVMGAVASIDFTRIEGRTNIAFCKQSGLIPGVTDKTIAARLELNGYNFYGSYATANQDFTFLHDGRVTGPFLWADSYVNQIWMNNNFQLALMTLLTELKSVPYNPLGYALIDEALADPINAAVTFGAIRAGVVLSALEAAEVNNQAGVRIDNTITQRGWYLQVAPASAQVRGNRGSPPVTLWYADGQSVQKINMSSVEVQ